MERRRFLAAATTQALALTPIAAALSEAETEREAAAMVEQSSGLVMNSASFAAMTCGVSVACRQT